MRQTLVLVTGPPAAGKTTLAAALGERLAIPVFCRDRIQEVLWDAADPEAREPNRFGPASAAVIFHVMEQLMRCGSALVVESYWHYDLANERLRALKEKYGYHTVMIRLFAPPEVLYDRLCARRQTEERHEALNGGAHRTLEAFAARIEATGCARMDIGGTILDIDTTDFGKVDMDRVVREIDSIRSSS